MTPRPHIPDAQRRARLIARHHLGATAGDVMAAVRGVVAVHSSDPLTPYLALLPRVAGFVRNDLDRVLYDERTLWRLHAMRRTLFVAPTAGAGVLVAAATREVAARERQRLLGWLAASVRGDVEAWLARVEQRVLAACADGRERRTSEVAEAVPELDTELTVGSGRWETTVRLSSRVLFLLAMDGHLVRSRPAGSWRSSQYAWVTADAWFAEVPPVPTPEEGRRHLAERYLRAHGPATRDDLRWWAGWTAAATRRALDEAGAVPVHLDSGAEGYVLPDDLEPRRTSDHVVALLPGLDPTTMGWKERGWYLGDHAAALFDRNGNAGPTVWVDGRVVGGWAQHPSGEVAVRLLEDVGDEAAARVDEEAAALTVWLGGDVVTPRFRTPLERELSS